MVTRCVCLEVPFDRVAALAAAGRTFEEICAATRCCAGCGLCEPYVRVVIESGRTAVPVMTPTDAQAVTGRARRTLGNRGQA